MKRLFTCFFVLIVSVAFNCTPSYAALPLLQNTVEQSFQQEVTVKTTNQKKLLKKNAKQADNQHRLAAIIMSVIIPFVGVAIWQDRISKDFWITLLLTAFLYVPGLIYALSVILNSPNY